MIFRAYKYRFYPTKEQKINLAKTFGCVRYVYNWGLDLRKEKSISYHENSALLKELRNNNEWLAEVPYVPLQQTLRHLNSAYSRFFKRIASKPTFKKKLNIQSAEYTKSAFKWKNKQLTLAKQDRPLKIKWSRHFIGNPTTVTITKDTANRYFVSFRVKEEINLLPKVSNKIGLDLGLEALITTSLGNKIKPPKYLRKLQNRLALAQRNLSRKKKGGKNREKTRLIVAKIHNKITDSRKDFTHKLTTKLIRENQTIFVESLSVKNMLRNHKLAKSISDASWSELLRQLKYKSEWYRRELVTINKWFPSSKLCSSCGFKLKNLSLSERSWSCPSCNIRHDRDINAAKNIYAVGLTVKAFGENVKPVSNIVIGNFR